MTTPNTPAPPDPTATLLSCSLVKPKDRLTELKQRYDKLIWCRAGRNTDHDCCEPFAVLDKALNIAKELGCSILDPWPSKKGDHLMVGQYLHSHLWNCECVRGEEINHEKFTKTLETMKDVEDYLIWRIKEVGVSCAGVEQVTPADVPKFKWDVAAQKYCVKRTGDDGWQHENKENAQDRLKEAKLCPWQDGDGLSLVDRELLNVRNYDAVDSMMKLAGYPEGVHEINGLKILVPQGYKLIQPEKGEFPHIWAILCGALVKKNGTFEGEEGFWTFLRHLQSSYLCLRDGYRSGSLAVFIVGPQKSAKTLIVKHIVTPLLGGRRANAKEYLTGKSGFNDELIYSELWFLDDASILEDHTARRKLNGTVKAVVADPDVPCRGLYRGQITLPTYRRFMACLNADDLESMPALSESLDDKYMLLAAKNFEMPEDLLPLPKVEDRLTFETQVRSELPAFLDWLLGTDLSKYSDDRFGAKAYKDPELLQAHEESSGLQAQYLVLCQLLHSDKDAVEMTAAQMWAEMVTDTLNPGRATQARAEFKSAIKLGQILGDMARSKQFPGVVTARRLGRQGTRHWTVQMPQRTDRAARKAARSENPTSSEEDAQ